MWSVTTIENNHSFGCMYVTRNVNVGINDVATSNTMSMYVEGLKLLSLFFFYGEEGIVKIVPDNLLNNKKSGWTPSERR